MNEKQCHWAFYLLKAIGPVKTIFLKPCLQCLSICKNPYRLISNYIFSAETPFCGYNHIAKKKGWIIF
jgi:hypothetical protein